MCASDSRSRQEFWCAYPTPRLPLPVSPFTSDVSFLLAFPQRLPPPPSFVPRKKLPLLLLPRNVVFFVSSQCLLPSSADRSCAPFCEHHPRAPCSPRRPTTDDATPRFFARNRSHSAFSLKSLFDPPQAHPRFISPPPMIFYRLLFPPIDKSSSDLLVRLRPGNANRLCVSL